MARVRLTGRDSWRGEGGGERGGGGGGGGGGGELGVVLAQVVYDKV